MPCSRVSSDGVALRPVTALQSDSNVQGRLARSGEIWGHTGRPPARCLWVRSFSGGPRSEPDGRLSAHPALQRSLRAVRGWLPPAACTQDLRHRFGVLHYAYLPASGHPQPPGPLRPAGGFPALPGGALLPRLLRGLCHRGTRVPVGDPAFVPVIRASATQAPNSSPWLPSLGIAPALEVRPHPTPCGRSAGHRFHASFRWGQGFTPAGD
jgi:hypothetical protein